MMCPVPGFTADIAQGVPFPRQKLCVASALCVQILFCRPPLEQATPPRLVVAAKILCRRGQLAECRAGLSGTALPENTKKNVR